MTSIGIGMDTRVPTPERLFEMAKVILSSVRWPGEQARELRSLVRGMPGRPRRSHCSRGHVLDHLNRGRNGSCLPCARERERSTRAASAHYCECGHAGQRQGRAKGKPGMGPCLHHNTAGFPDCRCVKFNRREESK